MNLFKVKDKELFKLQKEYRIGNIKEKDISKDKLDALKNLYIEEIKFSFLGTLGKSI